MLEKRADRDWKHEYRLKLERPEWRLKRLEVLEAGEFRCQRCAKSGVTLDIHHKRYVTGREPWEYGLEDLAPLCRECHTEVTAGAPLESPLKESFGKLLEHLTMRLERPKAHGFDADYIWRWVKTLPDRRIHRPLMKFAAWLYSSGTKDMGVLLAIVKDRCRRNPENPYAYYAPDGTARDCRSAQASSAIAEAEGEAFKRADALWALEQSRGRL